MKAIAFGLFGLLSIGIFAQETETTEEFLPIEVEGKEAFISTKTGEYTYLEHAKTDPAQLKTTASGVVYTDISSHTIKKGETLSAIAKKNEVTVAEIKKHNKVLNSNLKIGSKLKIVKKHLINSSSPVISYAGEERIIAKLRPGESPGQFAAPPSVAQVENKVIETKKSEEKPSAKIFKAESSVKNPILGLDTSVEENEDDYVDNLSNAINEEVSSAKENIDNEVIVTGQPIAETKQEKLARLKAEMKALEAEIDESSDIEEEKEVVLENNEVEETNVVTENSNSKASKTITSIKTDKEESNGKIDKNKNVIVFENKSNDKKDNEESIAEKAQRTIASVRKTSKDIKASKEKSEIKKEKEIITSEEKPDVSYYTVSKGNSLWSIARKHNMTVDALKKLNNLKNNNLDIGQKLKVVPNKK